MEQKELQLRMVSMIRGLRREHRMLRAQVKFERSMREAPPSSFSRSQQAIARGQQVGGEESSSYYASRNVEANRKRQEVAWVLQENAMGK